MKREIYLDHAATTPVDPEVLHAMLPYFSEHFGNPDSEHEPGFRAREAVDNARKTCAEVLCCRPAEIIFTSGGTESNNLALIGAARAQVKKGKHLITTQIEHPSVLDAFKYLETHEGYTVTYLPVDHEGLITPEELRQELTAETTLVSVIYAHNEIGTIEPIQELAQITRAHGALFHTDACQAAGALPLDTKSLGIDLMTINGSKIYGPKGVGILYKKASFPLEPILYGGGQEAGIRSGTLATPLIVGMAKALALANTQHETESARLTALRDHCIRKILTSLPKSRLNGAQETRLPNNINFTFPGVEGKELIFQLNAQGIYASTGSACAATREEASHVLTAIGLSPKEANASIRLTLGKTTTEEDLNYTVKVLQKLISP